MLLKGVWTSYKYSEYVKVFSSNKNLTLMVSNENNDDKSLELNSERAMHPSTSKHYLPLTGQAVPPSLPSSSCNQQPV